MFKNILEKPVLATVISIVIVILGVLGLTSLPITSYPEMAPPMVSVSTYYTGANAETVLKSVIAPIEEKINGVEGMTYMESTAGNDGSANIKVYFGLGYDPDIAAVNVQNRVSAATSSLPQEVTSYGITTEKQLNALLLMISIYSEDPNYDNTFMENFAKINVLPELQRVNGVGRVQVFGLGDYSIRVWLDPEKMSTFNLVPDDVAMAIREQNVEAAPGSFGEESETASFQYVIRYKGKFTTPEEYENIIIKAFSDGRTLRVKDVAKVELGQFYYTVSSMGNGKPGIMMSVYQMAGSNAKEVVDNITAKLNELQKTTFPSGIQWIAPYNTNVFLNASIHEVIKTLLEAFLLVLIVVLIFLQDIKSTIIPMLSASVAIIGTFFCLQMFGFTINMLTLFALVLSIGIVVDDAIVVVEAVHAKLEGGETDPRKAAKEAMSEISGAIVSISLVMSAVFIPVSFMSGTSGIFYKQFALTLASAVVLSAINALTLSPVMCAVMIKPHAKGHDAGFFRRCGNAFNAAFDKMVEKYGNALSFFSRKKLIPIGLLILSAVGLVYFMKTTPKGFIPNEDQGIVLVDVSMPIGTSKQRTQKVMHELDSIAGEMNLITGRATTVGASMLSDAGGGSHALLVFSLKDWEERPDDNVYKICAEYAERTSYLKDAVVTPFTPPTVMGFGMSTGFQAQLQDKSGGSLQRFLEVKDNFIKELNERPEIQFAMTDFNLDLPQYEFEVDVNKCKQMGLAVSDVFSAMQAYYGGSFVSDFNRFTKYYRVMIKAEPRFRENIHSINGIKVRNDQGTMVPLTTVTSFKRIYGPESLKRYNLFTAATINGAINPGYSTGDAIQAVREVGANLPTGYGFEFSGMTREEANASGAQGMIFLLCFIFVYLILSAQYESYILPWAVLIALVIGMCGVYLTINLVGLDANIYVQVALIMLIGLLAKNGILIVEFAKQRHEQGMSIQDAAVLGAKARLRPILMTSFAFILGLVPLCLANGAGALGNMSIGFAAAGGMLIGTLFGVFVIPITYIIFQTLDEKIGKKTVKIEEVSHE